MDFLKIDKNEMIDILLNDNKINVVREAIINGDYDNMIKKERLNYCTDEELFSLARNNDDLLLVMDEYTLSDRLIDIVINNFIEHEEAIFLIISLYMERLNPKHIEILLKYPKYKSKILNNQDRANKESTIYLFNKGIIKEATQKQLAVILPNNYIGLDLKRLTLDEICAVSYERAFTDEELKYVIEKIFKTGIDLYMKGYMDFILQSQVVPDFYLEKMVKEWEYTVDEVWFKRILKHQKLDSVIDYILDNHKLKRDSILLILKNKKTSPRKLIRLYKNCYELIVNSNSKSLPVIDCHLHMC